MELPARTVNLLLNPAGRQVHLPIPVVLIQTRFSAVTRRHTVVKVQHPRIAQLASYPNLQHLLMNVPLYLIFLIVKRLPSQHQSLTKVTPVILIQTQFPARFIRVIA
jgi:hypothetical protein